MKCIEKEWTHSGLEENSGLNKRRGVLIEGLSNAVSEVYSKNMDAKKKSSAKSSEVWFSLLDILNWLTVVVLVVG